MRRIQLGRTNETIPVIGLGTWRYTAGVEPLRRAIELGAGLIDTAEMYRNEEVVGRAVTGMRDLAFIATKVSAEHLRRQDLLIAADASLKRIGVDHLDLYQIHRPRADVPIAETMGAMEDLVDSGRVRFIGVSNFSRAQLEEAQTAMRRHPIVSNQVRYNLIDRSIERDLLPYCEQHGVTVIAYSPFAEDFWQILARDREGALDALAHRLGVTPAQITLRWCVSHPAVATIPKASSIEHVEQNCSASEPLEPADLERVERGVRPRRSRSRLEVLARRLLRRLVTRR